MWHSDLAPKVASEYLSGLGRRWNHVRGVGRLADALLADGLISEDVAAAAWLHDLGYAEELSSSGFHPVDGAEYLEDEGAPDDVVGLVANHTGAIFEAEERGLREMLLRFPRPSKDDLDVVTFLDLVTAADGSATDPETRVDEILSRYAPSSPVHRAITRSREDLLASASRARENLGLSDEWPAGVLESVTEP